MKMLPLVSRLLLLEALLAVVLLGCGSAAASVPEGARERAVLKLVEKHGAQHEGRIRRGVAQVGVLWRAEDGDEKAFVDFCAAQFIAEPGLLASTFERLESQLESIDGRLHEIDRDVNRPLQVDVGPILPIDRAFGDFSVASHLQDDLFKSRVAFVVLLNFPMHTLEERLRLGGDWNRETWAQARLAERFALRVPADVEQEATLARVRAEAYISDYNIHLRHLLTPDGKRLFPEGLRLITHWGLRDEIKAQYSRPDGLARQRMIARVMERIARQEIPAVVIDNPRVDWDPVANRVYADGKPVAAEREPDTRYRHLRAIFLAERRVDAHVPALPTFMARKFERGREIPERQVEALLEAVLTAPVLKQAAHLVEKRLGRKLEPFDIWYDGFRERQKLDPADLDRTTRRRYPTPAAFGQDIPRILTALGFPPETAAFVSQRVEVDPSRGAGHAMGAERRGDKARLRTRVGPDGMDYKGYNIAVHELGHNVEQVLSLDRIDHTLLHGVPNNAFTEALAFLFQERDLELLGLSSKDPHARHLHALDTLWGTYEIAGVALLEMRTWRWMYAHPTASEAELRAAVLTMAADIWNRYYAPVLGSRDVELLAIYSHMIEIGLYLPDYPLGHLIAFQLGEYLHKAGLGREMERMCRLGRLTPDLWMRSAVGAPLSADPLLRAAAEALRVVRK